MKRLEETIDTILNRQQHPYETLQILGKIKSESQRRQRLYESILSNTPDLAFIFDLDFKFIYANNATLKMWGISRDDATGKGLLELGYEPGHAEMHHKELKQVIATKKAVRGEVAFNNARSGWRMYEYIFVPVIEKNGKVEAVAGTGRDITQRKKTEEALARELKDMRRLQKVSTKFIRQGDIKVLLDEIAETALEIMDAQKVHIQMFDNESQKLVIKAQQGFSNPFPDRLSNLSLAEKTCSVTAFKNKRRILISDIKKSDAFADDLRDVLLFSDVRATQSTPLISRSGIALGILSTHWKDVHKPSERQLNLLDLLARQTADLIRQRQSEAALREKRKQLYAANETLEERIAERTAELQKRAAKLRDLASKLTSAKQLERKRLAAILHDDLQQLLVSAKIHVGFIHSSNSNGTDTESIKKVTAIIDQAIYLARDLTTKLRPPALFEEGFSHALEWLVADMRDRYRLEVFIHKKDTDYSLSDDIKVLLFESIRELLFNVVKYANTDEAFIVVQKKEGFLKVVVQDKGKGFDVEAVRRKSTETFGLFSVLERLDALGGSVDIESEPQKGTTVELKVPIAPNVSHQDPQSKSNS